MPSIRRAVARVCGLTVLAAAVACAGDGGVGTDTNPTGSALTVRISPKADSLGVGETRRFSAQVVDQAGVPRSATIAWMSINNTIATVNASGDVTALAPGLVGIVATIGSSADTASLYISVPQLVVEPNAVTTAVGEQIKLSATTRAGVAASGAPITWSSSDEAVATIRNDGTVTAVGPGEVTLVATSGDQTGVALISVKARDIGSLRVTPGTSSLYPNATAQLSVSAYDDAGRIMSGAFNPRWSSSNTAVLTVTDAGVVTGKARGSAVVTVRVNNKSATATVNVLDEPVATVSVSLDASTLEVGQITQAKATLKDAAGTTLGSRTIAWQSSNPAFATVNSLGVVNAVARGTVTISAIAEGKIGGASLTVAAKTVASVAITPNPASAIIGQSAQLTATPKDASGAALTGRTITWASANSGVATVSNTGVVTAVSAGSATISATADGVTGQATFNATALPAWNVTVSPTTPSVQVGNDVQLSATAYDANGNPLSSRVPVWASANPSVATVSSSGRVTGVSKGSANVSAMVDGKTATVAVAVNDPPPAGAASVSVVIHNPVVNVGQTTWANAVVRDASGNTLTGRPVTWSSAVPTIATVSNDGTVTTIAAGSVSIIATSEGATGAATLVVGSPMPQPVATVSLSATSTSMFPGQSQAITVTLRDASGNVLTGRTIGWTSSSGILTVSPSGQVTAVSAGTATITASSEGKSGTLTFNVTSAPVVPVASVVVAGGSSSLNVGQTTQLTATPKSSTGTVLTGRAVSWSSSAPGIASVSSGGAVTAVAAGSAMINANVEGVVGSMAMTVNSTTTGAIATVTVSLGASAVSVGQGTQASATARDASGNTVPASFSWSSSNTAVASVSSSGAVSAVGAGQATITATASGRSGSASLSVNTTTGSGVTAAMPELPRSVPSFAIPAPTRIVNVSAGMDLQAALNAAQRGDEIRLSGTFTGNYVIRSCGQGWITVRGATSLPAEGTRVTPATAAGFAKIVSNNTEAAVRTEGPACRWAFRGVEIVGTLETTQYLAYGIIRFGEGGDVQRSLSSVATDFVLAHSYVHGTTNHNNTRCVVLNSANTIVRDSWISECHSRGADSQAIEGWNGPGPFLIDNNFLAGAGENVMFGGADPGISNMSPSDITIRRNHFWKDPAWKGLWTVKNLFELKHAKRVLVEGNVFENNWADAQAGMAIVIKSLSDGETAPWTQSADVMIRYNIIRNTPRGFNVQGKDGVVAQQVARVRLEHNLFENIGQYNGTSSGWLNLITHMPQDIALVHNTMVNNTTSGLWLVMDYGNGGAQRLVFEDNVFTNPSGYALFYSGAPVGSPALNAMAGSTWSFARNVAAGVASDLVNAHPTQSWYPSSTSAVGFVSSTDYRLSSTSTYKGRGAGGTDPGADIEEIMRRTSGVKQQ